MASAADLVRLAFDYALERVVARAKRVVPAYVTREDLERAIIELRFADMELATANLYIADRAHQARMAELRERFAAERAAGDVVDVTIVEPTGDEPTHRPFARRHAYLGAARHIGCVFCGRSQDEHD
jgi:hypothetical protein